MPTLIDRVKYKIMRSVENKTLRDFITRNIASRIGKRTIEVTKTAFFNDVNLIESKSNQFNKEGILFFDNKLDQNKIDELLDFSSKLECVDPYRKKLGKFKFDAPHVEARLGAYDKNDLIQCKAIMDIANDSAVLHFAQEYLGATPTISSVNMWWSYPKDGEAKDAQIFHRDVDDYKFCKLFIYLTDVDDESGPHQYVKNTSHSPIFRKVRRYSDEEIIKNFKEENILEIKAEKGTAFLEDTYGFHKGVPPKSKVRLLFQVEYSLQPIFGYSYLPQKVEYQNNYDSYINRLFISNK